MKFLEQFSVKKLYDDLDQWIYIGIASDIYECRSHRKEYEHLVIEGERIGLSDSDLVKYVFAKLHRELQLPWYQRPTFWRLVKLFFKF